MAFTYTVDQIAGHAGALRIVTGTFTSSGSETGGDIKTGLSCVQAMLLSHTGSAVVADAPVSNETFPLNGGTVTIVTTAGADGVWTAIGI